MTDQEGAQQTPAEVTRALGSDPSKYGPEAVAAFTPSAPDSAPTTPATPPVTDDRAGTEVQPDSDESKPEDKDTRRQKGKEAYERGLREGREAAERERTERETTEQRTQAAKQATERVRKLVNDLRGDDLDTKEAAAKELADLIDPDDKVKAATATSRADVFKEIATSWASLGNSLGLDEADHVSLTKAEDPSKLVTLAFNLGKKSADERIAELEGELTSLRGKTVGTRPSPESANGAGGTSGRLSLEQYERMGFAERMKLKRENPQLINDMVAAAAIGQ